MSDYLPPTVLADILSRLPVKPLLRFRCVCKSWRSLISSPDFISAATVAAAAKPHHLLLRHFSVNPKQEHFSLRSSDGSFDELAHFKSPFETRSGLFFRVVGTSNGLVCLSDDRFGYTYTIIVWNPSIRRSVILPMPKVCYDDYGPYKFALGFGFDSSTNCHKVVRVAYLQGNGAEGGEIYLTPPKVEVYPLSTGKWKTVNAANVRYNMVEYFWSTAFVNGNVHWVAYNSKNNGVVCNVVLVFDMGSERFRELRLPEQLAGERPLDLSIAVCKDTISVIRYAGRGPRTCKACVVWIMKEYGVVESWSKQFKLVLDGGISVVLGFTGSGDLMVERWNGELVSYQIGNKEIKTMGVFGGRESLYVGDYVESLALLDGANGVRCDAVDSEKEDAALSGEEQRAVEGELARSSFMHYIFATCLSIN